LDARGGGKLSVHIRAVADIKEIAVTDPLAPWRGKLSQSELSGAEVGEILAALDADGLRRPPQAGLILRSNQFYWIAATCEAGRFRLTGWQYPGKPYQDLRFPLVMRRFDRSGVAFRDPGEPQPAGPSQSELRREGRLFDLQIGQDGLVGTRPVF
jgi:hypothetical protein